MEKDDRRKLAVDIAGGRRNRRCHWPFHRNVLQHVPAGRGLVRGTMGFVTSVAVRLLDAITRSRVKYLKSMDKGSPGEVLDHCGPNSLGDCVGVLCDDFHRIPKPSETQPIVPGRWPVSLNIIVCLC